MGIGDPWTSADTLTRKASEGGAEITLRMFHPRTVQHLIFVGLLTEQQDAHQGTKGDLTEDLSLIHI